jgi:hypothetical protein
MNGNPSGILVCGLISFLAHGTKCCLSAPVVALLKFKLDHSWNHGLKNLCGNNVGILLINCDHDPAVPSM